MVNPQNQRSPYVSAPRSTEGAPGGPPSDVRPESPADDGRGMEKVSGAILQLVDVVHRGHEELKDLLNTTLHQMDQRDRRRTEEERARVARQEERDKERDVRDKERDARQEERDKSRDHLTEVLVEHLQALVALIPKACFSFLLPTDQC
ncbi:hypothetical protein ONZ45_g19008 [Pleurotus djamor]|nr:hypothetical protein ONZ45_g19008 [Pleurotus djamor]